jgi:hypothetical protein
VLAPCKARLSATFDEGIRKLSWLSVGIEVFLDALFRDLDYLEQYFDRVLDLLEVRIESLYREALNIQLCAIPAEDAVWSVAVFESNSEAHGEAMAKHFEMLSSKIERSVDHLIEAVEIPFLKGP